MNAYSAACSLRAFPARARWCIQDTRYFASSSTQRKDHVNLLEPGSKVLVLSKLSRYEYEKHLLPDASEDELKSYLNAKGSDYDGLIVRHNNHHSCLQKLVSALEERKLQYHVVNRRAYDQKEIDWADAIVTAGGDGTFLLGASKLRSTAKPLIGVNTDWDRSAGYLLLPREFSGNFRKAIDRIRAGHFSWEMRQRIRVTMWGKTDTKSALPNAIDMHNLQLKGLPEYRHIDHVGEHEQHTKAKPSNRNEFSEYVLHELALNEVFIGESLSARVSYYEMGVDGMARSKQKSSGVTVCTGTGSYSWYFNINQISDLNMRAILEIINTELANRRAAPRGSNGSDATTVHSLPTDDAFVRVIGQRFNNSLRYPATERRMAYTVRDPVVNRVFPLTKPRGFAKKMAFRSRMWDGILVVDGAYSYRFNDGAHCRLEMFEEDALRCVVIPTEP